MSKLLELCLESELENIQNQNREVKENKCFLKIVNAMLETLNARNN